MPAKIAVALATYNPPWIFFEKFLKSLEEQSFPNWVCVVSDDSTDPAVQEKIQQRLSHDPRYRYLKNPGVKGVFYNFENALKECPIDVEGIACADQDDIWEKDKLQKMSQYLEKHPGIQLVHSDLKLIGTEDEELATSCWQVDHRSLDPNVSLTDLILRNSVTGCALLFRPQLLKEALPFPQGVKGEYLHDHWLALHARWSGPLGLIHEPLVRYRQHEGNAVGAESLRRRSLLKKIFTSGEILSRSRRALFIRKKLSEDFRLRREKMASREAGPGNLLRTENDSRLMSLKSLEQGRFAFYFSFFVRTLGKKMTWGLGLQLLIASFLRKECSR